MNLKKENKQSGGWFEIKIEYNVPAKNWTDYLISSCKNIHVVDVFFLLKNYELISVLKNVAIE